VGKRVAIEEIAFFTSSARITHHACCTTGKYEGAVSCQLKSAQHDLTEKIASMQRIRCWVESHVNPDRPGLDSLSQHFAVGGVLDESTRFEIGQEWLCRHRSHSLKKRGSWRYSFPTATAYG
jgi:hypothetical protein